MERLVNSGYFAPSKLRDLERNLMDLRQQLVQAEQTKNGLENQLSELNARQFSTTRSLQQTEIRAPVSGVILVSNINSSGVVVGAGDRVFEILPTNKRLIVEGEIPRHLARRLSVGTDVSLRFSSVQAKNSPNLEGELFFISPDAISQQQNAEPVFVVRAKVNGAGTDNPEYFQPGVPVEMLIRTGDHTLFEYLTKSIGDFLFRSMN
jgi:multidrug resistance efflux pump